MKYCFHVWAGAPSCYLEMLDKLQKRIYMVKLMVDPPLKFQTCSLNIILRKNCPTKSSADLYKPWKSIFLINDLPLGKLK